jgi:sugar lactone lactonase YvrE
MRNAARQAAQVTFGEGRSKRRADAVRFVGRLFGATALILLCLGTGSALAFRTHLPIAQTEVPGAEGSVTGIGVNNTTGHFYVTNSAVGTTYNFGPEGKLDQAHPQLTGAPGSQPNSLAVDNSSGPTAGTIWVGTLAQVGPEFQGDVLQYNSAGVATGLEVGPSSVPPDGTAQAGGLPPVVNNGRFLPRAIAVDAAGNLYVADRSQNSAIDKFSPAGVFIAQFAAGSIAEGVFGIAVDASGNIWYSGEGGVSGLYELNASGECVPVSCAPVDPVPTASVAADRSSGTILATGNGAEPYVAEYDEEGHLLGTSKPEDESSRFFAIAVNESSGQESSGRIYVGVQAVKKFFTFGPVTVLPDATTEAATAVGSDSAIFHGQVGADAGPAASCVFQYVDEAAFQVERFAHAQSIPCSPAGPFTGENQNPVSAIAGGLNGGTTYHYRLLATNANGSNSGEDIPFTTSGPSVSAQSVPVVSETGARLEATINPNGIETSYFFEIVSDAQFQQSGFAEAAQIPIAPLSVGAGSSAIPVSQTVAGLAPGTAYRFRAVARDANGAIGRGPASTFSTFSPANSHLPDGRAYEQASPTQKNANDAWGEVNAVKASASGDAITFYSTAGMPGATGGQFFGVYQANRTPDGSGWTTEGILPEAGSGYFARILGWSEDLSETYSTAKRSGEPPVLYARSRDGSLEPIFAGTGKVTVQQHVAATSASGEVVYFESAPGGSKKPGAYVWNRESETSTLVGVMNDGKAPAAGTLAGPYDWFNKNPDTERGGASAEYYLQAANSLSQDGKRAFFTEAGTGQLYVRLNPTKEEAAQELNPAECRAPSNGSACTIRISAPEEGLLDPNQPAAFLGATSDGNEAYFLSAGKLTADSTATNGRAELYRYDVGSGQLSDLTVDSTSSDPNGADVQGILGTVGDGSHIYFVANGVLAPGGTLGTCAPASLSGECNLYELSGGQIEFIARLDTGPTASPELVARELGDERDWAPTARFNGEGGGNGSKENTSRTSSDGRTLLFRSSRQLTGYANGRVPELYVLREGSPLLCVSCSPGGTRPTGPADLQSIRARGLVALSLEFGTLTRNLSSTGTRIFFDTPDALVANDTNGVTDAYEWEASGTGSCQSALENGGCLYLMSTGASPLPSYFGDASVSGNDAFFFTQQSLVQQDRDELYDVYDARVNGGIASQDETEPRICSGEECPAPAAGAPSSSPIGSAAPQAPNPKPKKCKKGFKRVVKHGKEQCVKTKKHKKHHKKHKKQGKRHAGHKRAGHGKAGSK